MPKGEGETTKATAHLPGMNLEIAHSRAPGGNSERISITIEAVPSFDAFARALEAANPFAYWMQVLQLAWLPWLAVTRVALPSALVAPLRELGSEHKEL